MGITFVVSVFLQPDRARAQRDQDRRDLQPRPRPGPHPLPFRGATRQEIRPEDPDPRGLHFIVTIAGVGVLLTIVSLSQHVVAFTPGLLLVGLGLGVMLTASVNTVQSSFPEQKQGEIAGLSRSVSNLGSSLRTAIAGTILVSELATGNKSYVLAMVSPAALALIELAAAMFLPANPERQPRAPADASPPSTLDTAAGHA